MGMNGIHSQAALLAVIWTGLCSYVCGGLAGLAVMKRWRGFAGMGLWNMLTIVGLDLRLAGRAGTVAGVNPMGAAVLFVGVYGGVFGDEFVGAGGADVVAGSVFGLVAADIILAAAGGWLCRAIKRESSYRGWSSA